MSDRRTGTDQEEREAEARRILDRVDSDSLSFLSGTMGRIRGHFSASDATEEGAAGQWAARIGRALGLVAFVILVINLFTGWFF